MKLILLLTTYSALKISLLFFCTISFMLETQGWPNPLNDACFCKCVENITTFSHTWACKALRNISKVVWKLLMQIWPWQIKVTRVSKWPCMYVLTCFFHWILSPNCCCCCVCVCGSSFSDTRPYKWPATVATNAAHNMFCLLLDEMLVRLWDAA